jgi:hypothetical protein
MTAPTTTVERPSLDPWLAAAGITALSDASSPATIETALIRLREALPDALDDLTRQTLRAEIRSRHPYVPAAMLDSALAPAAETTEPDDRPRRSQASRIVDLVHASGAELWHDAAGDPHITIAAADHAEHHRLRSRQVREWIARRYHAATSSAVSAQAIADALTVLAGQARYEGPEHATAVRVGAYGGAIYLDLGDPSWRAVEITPAGWWIEPRPRVRLIRSRGMRPLAEPIHGGSIDALRELVHVASDDDYVLLVGWLLGALRPTGPYPLLALAGEQGAGKSTAARVVQRLVDPSVADLRAEPRTIDEIMIAASRARVVALDNLSHLAPWLSDALCRLATGGALTRRELYTDDDEIIIEAMRPAIVTSITDVVVRGDLLDRAIAITLPVLPAADRRTEDDVWARFAALAPSILGALLDGVVSALATERTTTVDRLPRMADWARWCTAAEPGLGWPAGTILAAYRRMRDAVVESAIDGDPLATAIRAVSRPWTGTTAELLARLAPTGRAPRGWPESPRALASALRRLAPGLRRVDIEITHRRAPHSGARIVEISDRDEPDDTPDPPRPRKPAIRPSPSSPSSLAPSLLGGSGDGQGDGLGTSSPRPSPDRPSISGPRDDGDDGDDLFRAGVDYGV